jgi:hypothetical protein
VWRAATATTERKITLGAGAFALSVALASSLRKKKAHAMEPKPEPPVKPSPTAPPVYKPGDASEFGVFRSHPDDVGLHKAGWVELPSGVAITHLPLWDAENKLFARVDWNTAAEWMDTRGYRLPKTSELEELHQLFALFIKPAPLPTVPMLRDAGISPSNTAAVDAYRDKRMRSFHWCSLHDAMVFSRLRAAGWSGEPVANAGKHLCYPKGGIFGWWTQPAGPAKIQNLYTGHGPTWTSYAVTAHAVRT